MATVYCDDCGAIGTCNSTLFPPEKIMNEHMDKVHDGKEFGYSIWKD